jgi:hypothetical protein
LQKFQKNEKILRKNIEKIQKNREISISKNVVRNALTRSGKKFSHENKISNKITRKHKEKSHHYALLGMENALNLIPSRKISKKFSKNCKNAQINPIARNI